MTRADPPPTVRRMSFDPTEKISAGGSRLLTTAFSGRQAGHGYYDAVAITRPAGFQMLVMSRTRHAAIASGARVSGAKAGRAATHEFAGRDERRATRNLWRAGVFS